MNHTDKRAEFEKQQWKELKRLAANKNIKEFYRMYAEYLEKSGIHSESRLAIYTMAKAVAELMKRIEE